MSFTAYLVSFTNSRDRKEGLACLKLTCLHSPGIEPGTFRTWSRECPTTLSRLYDSRSIISLWNTKIFIIVSTACIALFENEKIKKIFQTPLKTCKKTLKNASKFYYCRESNPGPLALQPSLLPLDHSGIDKNTWKNCQFKPNFYKKRACKSTEKGLLI